MAHQRKPHAAHVTLADVAQAARTSIASASRALARPELVGHELHRRVCEAAQKLAYVPNGAARALVRRRSGLIGVVVGDLDGSALLPALFAIEERLAGAGWGLLLGWSGARSTTTVTVRALLGRGVEGLVFVGVDIPDEPSTTGGLYHLPCASVGRDEHTGFIASAGLALRDAGTLLTDYLRQLGHRHVAVVAEPGSPMGALLLASVRSAATSHAMRVELLDLSEETVAAGVERWAALPDAPSAAICGSDAVALAVMSTCAGHRIGIPDRLSVVGFGDTPLARHVVPTLTSLRVPATGAGAAAAECLLAQLAERPWPSGRWPVKLAIRGTTGPPGRPR